MHVKLASSGSDGFICVDHVFNCTTCLLVTQGLFTAFLQFFLFQQFRESINAELKGKVADLICPLP